jgi:hypothetical protein
MKPAVYPDTFLIAHRLFTGSRFPAGGVWGDILDGPMTDDEDVIEGIIEAFKNDEDGPSRDDLRVWYIAPGKPAEDWTAWAVTNVFETVLNRRS